MRIKTALKVFALSAITVLFAVLSVPDYSSDALAGTDESADKEAADRIIVLRHGFLSAGDIELYKKIKALQEKERWQDADKVIAKLDNKILMGYILGQRYLESATWKTKSKEAIAWMNKYSDLPIAGRIYELGKMKGASFTIKKPKDVDTIPSGACSSYALSNPIDLITGKKFANLPQEKQVLAKRTMHKIVSAINHGKTLIAYNLITSKEAESVFKPSEIDAAKIALAFLYFTDLRDDKALEVIEPAIARSGKILPIGEWVAGLIYWRIGEYENAKKAFASAASNPRTKAALKSAAAFWTARACFKTDSSYEAQRWLELASETPRYFYGILARRGLGESIDHEWERPESDEGDEDSVIGKLPVQRAIALYQVGLDKYAEDELLKFYVKANNSVKSGLIDLSEKNDLKDLSQVMVSLSGKMTDSNANYPAPNWAPLSGWKVKKALVYAFVRQESCFNNNAVSKVGAKGLMQLMPSTAKEITKSLGLEYSTKRLAEPSYNLEIGQAYIHRLLKDRFIDGNLIFLAVAYNSGPGNLYRWNKRMDYKEDPLLFIESIPSKETRGFVQKILANYWVYSSLFGDDLDSLDAIIEGSWAKYE